MEPITFDEQYLKVCKPDEMAFDRRLCGLFDSRTLKYIDNNNSANDDEKTCKIKNKKSTSSARGHEQEIKEMLLDSFRFSYEEEQSDSFNAVGGRKYTADGDSVEEHCEQYEEENSEADDDYDYDRFGSYFEQELSEVTMQRRCKKRSKARLIKKCPSGLLERSKAHKGSTPARRRKRKRVELSKLHYERVKNNIQLGLAGNGLYRAVNVSSNSCSLQKTGTKHALLSNSYLKKGNAMNGLAADVLQMQYRELTPNDYELLLSLDNSIPKKTLSYQSLQLIPKKKIIIKDIETDAVGCCCICLQSLDTDDSFVKKLPKCGHIFHATCIDTWLKAYSNVCPLDSVIVSS
eukprot:gene15776-17368_t